MKNLIFLIFFPILFLSCSKKASEQGSQSHQPSSGLPFEITVVDTPEAKEQESIRSKSLALFKQRDYDKLEAMIAGYRSSKECYADGAWKLKFVYDALSLKNIEDSERETFNKEIQDWIKTAPNSLSARITMSRFLRDDAWRVRGGGYADTVSNAAWEVFGEKLNQAWKILYDGRRLTNQCPVYWSTLMGVSLGLQLDKTNFNALFEKAITSAPDYESYYNSRATYLLPRWYGDEGEWEKDLAQSADRIGGEKGDMLYARVVWHIHQYGCSENVFTENKALSWERVDRGFEVIEKYFPDSLAAKNERAHLAAQAGDKEKARKYFAATKGMVDLTDWTDKDEYVAFVNWAFCN